MSFHQFVYISTAVPDISHTDLDAILCSAREFNHRHEITGMLLFCKRTFMQVLEGEKESIQNLMEQRINRDRRHYGIHMVNESVIPQRSFADWSMGFSALDGVVLAEKNYTRFLEEGFTTELVTQHLDVAHKLLLSFRDVDDGVTQS